VDELALLIAIPSDGVLETAIWNGALLVVSAHGVTVIKAQKS
jgi:hypothetical protein